MKNDHTLFEAMQAFDSLSGAVAFTANEIALFYAILYSWNAARRPEMVQQWANTTCTKCALDEKNTLPNARNGLVQKGVIFFYKKSNRSVPHYSLNPLFHKENPFLLLISRSNGGGNSSGKGGSKHRVNMEVNTASYQEKEQEEEEVKKPLTPKRGIKKEWKPDSNQIIINALFRRRDTTRWSETEIKAYKKLEIDEKDMHLINLYYNPEAGNKYTRNDIKTLLNNWQGEVDRASAWLESQATTKTTSNSDIVGGRTSHVTTMDDLLNS